MNNNKVTKRVFNYPLNMEPNMVVPQNYGPNRYCLGKIGCKNLAIIGMNPSSASKDYADATIAKILKVALEKDYDGWFMFNIYPERATNQKDLDDFSARKCLKNINNFDKIIKENNITEVWCAWGNLNHKSLVKSKEKWIEYFEQSDIKLFHFNEISKQRNPKHPLYLKISWDNKKYIDLKDIV